MISREEMLNIANLSKLYLSEEEIESAMKEMDGMIDFVNQINSMDNMCAQTFGISSITNAFHEDEVEASMPQSEILKNADGGKDGFFYIKKFA